MSELAKALLAFQKDAPDLHRDATNPHFGSKFLSLDGLVSAVTPVANRHGIVISQWVCVIENGGAPKPALRTRLIHADSGETYEDAMLLLPGKDDPQGQGSAITYARRYSLMAALGLVADEDDDGNAAASSGAGRGGSSVTAPAPDKPFSKARPDMTEDEYLALVKVARSPGATASFQVCHFGSNKGVRLGEMEPDQIRWYAESWKMQDEPSEYDHRFRQAAIALHAGQDTANFLVPF